MPISAANKKLLSKRIDQTHSWKNPLWKGPRVDGITFSMISRWLYCRHRFKLQYIDGYKAQDAYSHRMEFGNLWHICEQYLEDWREKLAESATELAKQYPQNREKIGESYSIIKRMFPIYLNRYKGTKTKRLDSERIFEVGWMTSRGQNSILLRGKLDGVDEERTGLVVQENKTRSEIDSAATQSQLCCDLQSMMYVIAAGAVYERKVSKVRYNCVLRPLSGGKFSVKQHKGRKTKKGIVGAETEEQFYNRLGRIIQENQDHFFARFDVVVSEADLKRFTDLCLDPILDQICLWYDAIVEGEYEKGIHFLYPYGVFNPTLEGYGSDLDGYLSTGSVAGLQRVKKLFTELE